LFFLNGIIGREVIDMATLRDYIIDEEYLQTYGIVPKDYMKDAPVGALLEEAFQMLITRIFDLNPNMDIQEDIYDFLFNADFTQEKRDDRAESFRYAQKLIVSNLLNLDENPISAEVDSVIANRLKLKKVNGFQK
jgi:hypothetical protein